MGTHRDDWLDRDDDERRADIFAWVVLGLVGWLTIAGFWLIATNRWPT
jgi:hypothetical protein